MLWAAVGWVGVFTSPVVDTFDKYSPYYYIKKSKRELYQEGVTIMLGKFERSSHYVLCQLC